MRVSGKKSLEALKEKGKLSLFPEHIRITIGMATCGLSKGAGRVKDAIKDEVRKQGIKAEVVEVGCMGFCYQEPTVGIICPGRPKIIYGNLTPERVPQLLEALRKGTVKKEWAICRIEREEMFLTGDQHIYTKQIPKDLKTIPAIKDLPFFKKQKRVVLRNAGLINPESIEEYVATGGYASLQKVLTHMKPEEVIDEVIKAGLRGRSGGGFPAGVKWQTCNKASGKIKYIVCNISEGDPGIGMHKSLLESDPHSILEGMIIAAYAIGAKEGYIYISSGYPLGVKRMEKAIKDARAYGFLGRNILKSGFNFTVSIKEGGGAYVCGEETALIKSIEGESGEPRQRPPFPAISGLWGKPTVINNLETLANVPVIITKGAKWYSSVGLSRSPGTKVFSLIGEVNRPGLIEVPLGITLREIIYEIGGGLLRGKSLKAVLMGGTAGGCLPKKMINLSVDYETLTQAGSAMSSGGLIVMDEKTCMVDLVKYYLSFLESESCGKCTPCRVGLRRMHELLTEISKGKGSLEDLEFLERMSNVIKEGALCNLGKTAPNTFLSTLKYFKDEYLIHIQKKKCPASVCMR